MDITVLHNSILFKGFDDTEISELLKALNAAEKKYNKGEMIFSSGEITDKLCFVTAGSVTVESNDMWGNYDAIPEHIRTFRESKRNNQHKS